MYLITVLSNIHIINDILVIDSEYRLLEWHAIAIIANNDQFESLSGHRM